MGKKTVLKFIFDGNPEDRPFDEHEMAILLNASKAQVAIWDALQDIRSRLKYGENVSEEETRVLEGIRAVLYSAYIEEG